MGRRNKGQSQRNPLPPQPSPRLPAGSRRRPATAGVKHHVTASRRVPASGPHRIALETRAAVTAAGSRNRDLYNPSPAQVSRRQARPAPSPNTHSRSTARAASPPSSPRPLSPDLDVKPTTQALRTSSRCQGAPANMSASLPPLREDIKESRLVDSRQATETHREGP